MRSACPYPFADFEDAFELQCNTGRWINIYRGLDLQHTASRLIPYRTYEFRLQVFNRAGGLEVPPIVKDTTLPAGTPSVSGPTGNSSFCFVTSASIRDFPPTPEKVEPRPHSTRTVVQFRDVLQLCTLPLLSLLQHRATCPRSRRASSRPATCCASSGPSRSRSTGRWRSSRSRSTADPSTSASTPCSTS